MKRDNNYQNLTRERERIDIYPGYPSYCTGDDIYLKAKEEREIDPEVISGKKETTNSGKLFRYDLGGDKVGSNLDVPGSELDDNQEIIGSEDEENNYYSLGDEGNDEFEYLLD